MKNLTIILLFLLMTLVVHGRQPVDPDTVWKFEGVTSLNFSQLSLSNWAAGGENSLSGNALVKLSADYDNGITAWDNDLAMGFGLIKQGDSPARKSDDQLELSSKIGYRASERWNYSGLLSFRTQFAEGYDRPGEEDRIKISNFMAPAYLNLSAGFDFRPNDRFSMLIAPLSGKVTFVLDEDLSDEGSFGLDPGQQIRGEFGGYIKVNFKQEILTNVLLDTKIDLFSNYLENPRYVDVNWDLLLTFKVNEFLSASLLTQLIYDRDIEFDVDTTGDGVPDSTESRVQFKELLGVGLTYSF